MTKYRIIQIHDGKETIKPAVFYSLDTVRRELAYLRRSRRSSALTHRVQELHSRRDTWHYITI